MLRHRQATTQSEFRVGPTNGDEPALPHSITLMTFTERSLTSTSVGNCRHLGAGLYGSIPLKVGGVHFGHFLYCRLQIAKVRQEHFALKRRVRFRRHVVAMVDTLD